MRDDATFEEMLASLGGLGGETAKVKRLEAELAAMTNRAATAERRIAAVLALVSDPGESHRMLTRREITRLLRSP